MTAPAGTTAADPVAAVLEEIRENARFFTSTHPDDECRPGESCTGHDAVRMAAGYDALLKLADEYENRSAYLSAVGGDDYEPPGLNAEDEDATPGDGADDDPPAWAARADALREAASRIRSVIAAALTGEETPS